MRQCVILVIFMEDKSRKFIHIRRRVEKIERRMEMKKFFPLILACLMAVALIGCKSSEPNVDTEKPVTEETPVPSPDTTPAANPNIEFYADYSNIPDFGSFAGVPCADKTAEGSSTFYVYKYADILNSETNLSDYYKLLEDEGYLSFDITDEDLLELGAVCYVGMCGNEAVSIVIGPIDVGEFAIMIFGTSASDSETDANQEEGSQQEPSPTPTLEMSEPTPVPTPSTTMGQRNALAKAKDYLSIMAFSYSGLIDQLEYEGYTTEEATYGADNCGADWNEQAAKKAQDYIDLMAFSKQGLIDQLKYEGFTQAQAEYGAAAVGY